MEIQKIDGTMLRKMFEFGAQNLETYKSNVDELNVFPVPDGDTGTNMSMTFANSIRELDKLKNDELYAVSKTASSGALFGARGNSGVILSQLLRGLAKANKGKQVLDIKAAADGIKAAEGADAVVCTVPGVPVRLCFADCAPVVLVAPGGFAVVHSGWRGTLARISAKAARVLCERTGADVADVWAYVGPHVGAGDYEVSEELIGRFRGEFGARIEPSSRHLDLASAIGCALEEAGVAPGRVAWVGGSTASETDRFFSYRASGGHCGRHGAIALMPGTD